MARIMFMGTPDYARTILASIFRADDEVLVITKPDRPQGRGRQMMSSSVAMWASGREMIIQKPERLKDFRTIWERFDPDWILTAAYGKILPPWLLALPRLGAYNLHASLLPRWRGPNPIAWAIREQDAVTGVTLMGMDVGIDTGPIVAQTSRTIDKDDEVESLTEKLAQDAATLWTETRRQYGDGPFPSHDQPDEGISYAEKFSSDAGHVNYRTTAKAVDAMIRSVLPHPGAYSFFNDLRVNILEARPDSAQVLGSPGTVVSDGHDWLVATDGGSLRIALIRPAGKRAMRPADYVRGLRGEALWMLT